jgi:hypothetical protein
MRQAVYTISSTSTNDSNNISARSVVLLEMYIAISVQERVPLRAFSSLESNHSVKAVASRVHAPHALHSGSHYV